MDPVSVALKVGVTPLTAWLFLFLSVIATEAVEEPSAVTVPRVEGPAADAAMEEFAATTVVSTKVTVAVMEAKLAGEEIPIVFTSSMLDLKAPVDTPLELLEAPWVMVLPEPDTVNTGLTLVTGLL